MTGLTDTHCHLNLNLFQQDLAEVLDRAWNQGLKHILIPGVDLETSRTAVELAIRDPRLHAAIGFHPNDAYKWNEDSYQDLINLAQSPKVVAIGEIGLDYYRDRTPKESQRWVLQKQLDLATYLNKPVVLHSRDSIGDLWPILQTWQNELHIRQHPLANHPGVLHSYEGNAEIAMRLIASKFFLGVSGPVTFKNAVERQRTVSAIPLESILIETDAPYLAPHPHRGQRNEPGYVVNIAQQIARLKNISFDLVLRTTTFNAQALFNWE